MNVLVGPCFGTDIVVYHPGKAVIGSEKMIGEDSRGGGKVGDGGGVAVFTG